ncbi:MAG: RecX family transcriptional regulator [Firmicutes bacterium]|nr:RecX family transcriptional regulator [Bacillota bacterium]
MPIITSITPNKKNKNRSSIFLDGEYALAFDNFIIFKHRLKEGDSIEEEKLLKMQREDMGGVGFEKAVNYTLIRMRSEKEMRLYLKEKGYMQELINEIIEKLCSYNYINDAHFAKLYVDAKKSKWGESKIKYELRQKGVKSHDIEQAFEDFDGSDEAYEIGKKYLKGDTKEHFEKLKRYLFSKGFSFSDINSSIIRIKEEIEEANEFEDEE